MYLRLAQEVSPFRSEAYTALISMYLEQDRGPEAADMMLLAYENTDRENFRQQREDFLPAMPEVSLTAGRYEISAMEQDISLTSPQGYDVYYLSLIHIYSRAEAAFPAAVGDRGTGCALHALYACLLYTSHYSAAACLQCSA